MQLFPEMSSSRACGRFLSNLLLLAGLLLSGSSHAQSRLEVLFAYGSEKEEWIKAVTADYNKSRPKTTSGKSVTVRAIPMGTVIEHGHIGPCGPAGNNFHRYLIEINTVVGEAAAELESHGQVADELRGLQIIAIQLPQVIAAGEFARPGDKTGASVELHCPAGCPALAGRPHVELHKTGVTPGID